LYKCTNRRVKSTNIRADSLLAAWLNAARLARPQRRALRNLHALHRRSPLRQLGLAGVFEETENPLPWMSEAMDLKKEKNFFETRVIEYQNGGALEWD
jgi:hypothetical protein